MKKLCLTLMLILALLGAAAQTSASIAGRWEGSISLPTTLLKIGVALQRSGADWQGTIDVPSQGVVRAPLGDIRVEGRTVHFVVADMPGALSFDGEVEGHDLGGIFTQNQQRFGFSLVRQTSLSEKDKTAAISRGRSLTRQFYEGALEPLYSNFSAHYQTSMSRAQLEAFQRQVESQLGTETRLRSEEVKKQANLVTYTRTSTFSNIGLYIALEWVVDNQGKVQGLTVSPRQDILAPTTRLGYRTKTVLTLPFAGSWYVFWGGRQLRDNYHAASPDQRFATDLVIRRQGSSYRGSGSALSDYYCFGKPIYAPGNGTVVAVVNDRPDNAIGQTDPRHALGNHVVIDHDNGEYSFLAHLKRGSVWVRLGELVRSGEPLGACGNSGNTSEPHLHYHLQTNDIFYGGTGGEGLPAQFQNYRVNGQRVARGELMRGQTVAR